MKTKVSKTHSDSEEREKQKPIQIQEVANPKKVANRRKKVALDIVAMAMK